jgi:hypothetical protein
MTKFVTDFACAFLALIVIISILVNVNSMLDPLREILK